MKKEWQKPVLELLDVNKTMAGPGIRIEDARYTDPDEVAMLRYS